MSDVFFLALLAAVNPTLLAAVTVMLVLPSPKRLLIGYLLGAYVASITLGLVFVFALAGTATENTARTTISPISYIVVGLLLLVVWAVLRSGRGAGLRKRRQARKAAQEAEKGKKEPFTQRLLGRGSARGAFAAGVVLNMPGVSYLTALHLLDKQDPGPGPTILVVIAFNIIMLLLIELPLIGYVVAPEWTTDAVARLRAWLGRNARALAVYGSGILGVLLVGRGVIGLV